MVVLVVVTLAACGSERVRLDTAPSTTSTAVLVAGLHVEIEAPETARAGELVDIRASVRDDEGKLESVEARFGDDGPATAGGYDLVCSQSADDPSPREPATNERREFAHAYRSAGTYDISVSARSGGCFTKSETVTATATIRILGSTSRTNGPLQPEPSFTHEYYVDGDRSRLVTDITGWDHDGFVYRLVLEWGDESNPYVLVRPLTDCKDAPDRWPAEDWLQRSPSHRYARDGEYTLTLRAFSSGCDGGSKQESPQTTIVVVNPPVQGSDDPDPAFEPAWTTRAHDLTREPKPRSTYAERANTAARVVGGNDAPSTLDLSTYDTRSCVHGAGQLADFEVPA